MISLVQDALAALPDGTSLVRIAVNGQTHWAVTRDGAVEPLDAGIDLAVLLRADGPTLEGLLRSRGSTTVSGSAEARLCAPLDSQTEVWAAGVTYERSRAARVSESSDPDIYTRVYSATRPELFFKALGWRTRGWGEPIAVRKDSQWNVPEPELAAVLRADGSIFGWTICNDVSSRSIEGENPLYLPQAKVYAGSCALGPAVVPAGSIENPYDLTIAMSIERDDAQVWSGRTSTAQLRRRVDELARYLFDCQPFPQGVVLSTGTSLVPDAPFTLADGDTVRISIDSVGQLLNAVGTT